MNKMVDDVMKLVFDKTSKQLKYEELDRISNIEFGKLYNKLTVKQKKQVKKLIAESEQECAVEGKSS